MRIGIEVIMRGESCENNAYTIVYGMRVNLDPIRNTYNIVQEGFREIRWKVAGALHRPKGMTRDWNDP